MLCFTKVISTDNSVLAGKAVKNDLGNFEGDSNYASFNVRMYNTNFIPLSYIEHVKHEAYVQKRKYLCSVMAAIEKTTTHTHSHTHIATQCNGSCC